MFPLLLRSECVWTVRAIRDWTNVSAEQKGFDAKAQSFKNLEVCTISAVIYFFICFTVLGLDELKY